jgi:hypothetical protein
MRKSNMPTVYDLMPLTASTTSFKGDWIAALLAFLPTALIGLLIYFAIQ